MKVTVNQRCVLIVILAMVFLLALLNGILQSEQGNQEISETAATTNHPVIKSPKPSQVSQKDEVINPPLYINHASVNEIAKRLKGVGKKIAQRIVKTREQLSDFKKLEDLKAVPGMGSAKIEANKERISFDSPIPKE